MSSQCLITATDRNYFVATEVMLRSVDANYHGEEKLDVFVFVPKKLEDWKFYKTEYKNLSINFIYPELADTPEWQSISEKMFENSMRVTSTTMYKFFFAEYLKEYNKGIYLDPDTVIMRDIQPLLDFQLSNPVGAFNENHLEHSENSTFKDVAMFNSGVMVIDLKSWRVLNILKMIKKAAENFKEYSTGNTDQDVFNVVFKNNWTPLPMSFNYLVNIYPNVEMTDPLVVHWAGNRKPWSNANNDKWRQAWKYYRQLGPTTM